MKEDRLVLEALRKGDEMPEQILGSFDIVQ